MKNKQIAEINNIGLRDSAIKAVNTLPDLIKVGSLKIERKNLLSALAEPHTHVLHRKSENILKCPPKSAKTILRRLGITPPNWRAMFAARRKFNETSPICGREYGLMVLEKTIGLPTA